MSFYTDKEFFEGKRPWSKIKDQVLGSYLSAYLAKVNQLGNKIILVDAFAGPGKFDDGTTGSPLMICQIAEKLVKDNYTAILVNNNEEHHIRLEKLLSKQIEDKKAITINGEASELLSELTQILSNETLLIYLDPFGLKGCEFVNLIPFLKRPIKFSTEIIINLSVPIIHRLANKNNELEGKGLDDKAIACRKTLSSVLGGDYWKEYLFNDKLSPNQQIENVMLGYKKLLEAHLPFVGYCPVFETTPHNVKYYIFFASRHIDAPVLMNDIMFKAYWTHIWNTTVKGTLFETEDQNFILPSNYDYSLKENILSFIEKRKLKRSDLWKYIVINHFMRYSGSDFKKAIAQLVKENKISFKDVRGTGRLNDESLLFLKK